MKVHYLDGAEVFVVENFLSPEECERLIDRSEQLGYVDAPLSTVAGFVMRKEVRDNLRVVLDDPELAAEWWGRAKSLFGGDRFGWTAVGLNERFRFYRYDRDHRFNRHSDGYFERDNGERSHFTFMVYLNDGFEGGATAFHEIHPLLLVTPERGKGLVFYHHQIHEGMPVVQGRKYVLRTDVMYRRNS